MSGLDLATKIGCRAVSLLEAAWDDGNAMGLDGWVGPERGTEPDDHAIRTRERKVDSLVDELVALVRRYQPGDPEPDGYCTCNGADAGGRMGDCGIAAHRAEWRDHHQSGDPESPT